LTRFNPPNSRGDFFLELAALSENVLDMAREWEQLAEQQKHATDLRKKE